MASLRTITADEDIFSSSAYDNACLYVLKGRKEFYERVSPWKKFIIKEMDFAGVEIIRGLEDESPIIYNLNGCIVDYPSNGVHIINGRKVMKIQL